MCMQMVACFARLPGASLPAEVRRRRQCSGRIRWAPLTVKSGIHTWAGMGETKQKAGLMHEHASWSKATGVDVSCGRGPKAGGQVARGPASRIVS